MSANAPLTPAPTISEVGPLIADALRVMVLWLGCVSAKALVVAAVFDTLGPFDRFVRTLRGSSVEHALVSALFLMNAVIPPGSSRIRRAVFGGVPLVAIGLTCIATGLFMSWGNLIDWNLVALAPDLLPYARGVGLGAAQSSAVVLVLSFLGIMAAGSGSRALSRFVTGSVRSFRIVSAGAAILAAVVVVAPKGRPAADSRTWLVERVGLASYGYQPGARSQSGPIDPNHDQALAGLLGSEKDESPMRALESLRGSRPNIVLWVAESVGARYIRSLHSEGLARTPFLDAEMGNGVSFSRAYAESPLTVQTAWALLTGESPPARPFIFLDEDLPLPQHTTTLSRVLRSANYQTAMFGSSYFDMWGTRRIFDLDPFDRFVDGDDLALRPGVGANGVGVEDRAMVDEFFSWLGHIDPGRPFFSMLWTIETHKPYTWAGMRDEEASLTDPERYVLGIERADALMGRMLEELRRRRLRDSTLVIVVGDHGEGMGRPPRPWDVTHSGQVYEDDVHVPLIFLHPSLKTTRIETLVTHRDLLPTLGDIVGVDTAIDGAYGLLRPVPPRALVTRSILWVPMAIITPRYKAVLQPYFPDPELFDLDKDTREETNVSAELPRIHRILADEMVSRTRLQAENDKSFRYGLESMPPGIPNDPATLQWRGRPR